MDDSSAAPGTLTPADLAPPAPTPRDSVETPTPAQVDRRAPGWTRGRTASLVSGVLVAFIAVVFLGAGGTALWADRFQRESGFATTDVHRFTTTGSALVTKPTDLGTHGIEWLYAPDVLGDIRIRVTPADPNAVLFIGIGPSSDVARYLAAVNHTVISDYWTETLRDESGGTSIAAPETQTFWVATATGAGAQNLTWNPENGSWSVVVMNADGRAGIDVRADLGARFPALPWVGLGVLLAGLIFAAGGLLLLAGALRRR